MWSSSGSGRRRVFVCAFVHLDIIFIIIVIRIWPSGGCWGHRRRKSPVAGRSQRRFDQLVDGGGARDRVRAGNQQRKHTETHSSADALERRCANDAHGSAATAETAAEAMAEATMWR